MSMDGLKEYKKTAVVSRIIQEISNFKLLQDDPNQNLRYLLAITLKICNSDPMLVKPKCVWQV